MNQGTAALVHAPMTQQPNDIASPPGYELVNAESQVTHDSEHLQACFKLSRHAHLPFDEVEAMPRDKLALFLKALDESLTAEALHAGQMLMLGKQNGEHMKRHREVTGKQWTEISELLRERKLDEILPFTQRTLPKMVAAALDEFERRASAADPALVSRSLATVAAFVQRHTGMGTAEFARMSSTELLDLADTVLKQDRQQAHEEMSAKMKRRVDQWEEIKDLAAELGLRGKDGQTLPQILREALTGGNDIALLRRLAEDRRVESNKAKELDQICDLLNAYGHLKTESTLEQNLRRVFSDLQHWRTFTHRQARRTGAAMPKDGELTAEQAVEHFDLVVSFGRQIADELQQVRDLVLDRQSRMSANASKAVGLLDVLRGLIADAHVPSVDARDMAELRARAEAAEAETRVCAGHRVALANILRSAGHPIDLDGYPTPADRGDALVSGFKGMLDDLRAAKAAERVVYTDTSGGAVTVIAELQTSLADVRRTNKQLQDLILKERATVDALRLRVQAAEKTAGANPSCTQVTRTGDGYELHVASIGDLLGEGAYKINVANPATIRRRGDSRDFTVIGCRGYEYDAPLGAGTIYLHPECTGDNFREGTVLKLKA